MTSTPDPFDRLHDQLVTSAAGATDRAPARRRRPSRRIALFATAAVLVGGTAVAATTPWNPQIGPDRGRSAGGASLSRTSVPAEQRAALGVFRREQTDRDRSTPTENALRDLGVEGRGARLSSIRLLRSHDGAATFLTSVKQLGNRRHPPATANAICLSETTTKTDREGAAKSTVDTAEGPIPAPVAIGGATCASFDDVLRGRMRTTTTGVVPDGVARVRVELTTGRVLDARVRDNFYALPLDVSNLGASPNSRAGRAAMRRFRSINGRRIDWLDSDGQVRRKNDIARDLRRNSSG